MAKLNNMDCKKKTLKQKSKNYIEQKLSTYMLIIYIYIYVSCSGGV